MKRLHLLVSGLCPDFLDVMPEHLAALPLGNLRALLARGQSREAAAGASLSDALGRLFGHGGLAVAPLTLLADGVDPAGHWWMRADPVHLDLGLDHIVLRDAGTFALNQEEAAALVRDLNAHLGGAPLLSAPRPQRWYARFSRPLDVAVPSLATVAGSRLDPDQVKGADAAHLQRLGNEVQMLLHDHPVNVAREARGELQVNGLWFWGGGQRQPCTAAFDRILADDFTALALAGAAGITAVPLPPRFRPREQAAERVLVVLDSLQSVVLVGDVDGWRLRLQALDADWFGPLLAAVRAGRIGELVLEAVGRRPFSLYLDRGAAWRVWRREHPICAAVSRRSA